MAVPDNDASPKGHTEHSGHDRISPSAETHIDSANERAPVWNEGEKARRGVFLRKPGEDAKTYAPCRKDTVNLWKKRHPN
jgi:hypothetical protein